MRAAWDPITLRVESWNATHQPQDGDELRTARGRRYQIIAVCRRGARITALKCLVLPGDAAQQGRLFLWTWGAR